MSNSVIHFVRKLLMDMIFVAQLWKYTSGRLENKNGHWMYMEETWSLPNKSSKTERQVIKDSLGKVLTVQSNNKGMPLKIQNTKQFCTLEIFLVLRYLNLVCTTFYAIFVNG